MGLAPPIGTYKKRLTPLPSSDKVAPMMNPDDILVPRTLRHPIFGKGVVILRWHDADFDLDMVEVHWQNENVIAEHRVGKLASEAELFDLGLTRENLWAKLAAEE